MNEDAYNLCDIMIPTPRCPCFGKRETCIFLGQSNECLIDRFACVLSVADQSTEPRTDRGEYTRFNLSPSKLAIHSVVIRPGEIDRRKFLDPSDSCPFMNCLPVIKM